MAQHMPVGVGVEASEMDDDDGRRRTADNEALFRSINERIEVLNEAFDRFGYGEWTCECPDVRCTQTIELTTAEYEAVRAFPTRFAVAPSEAHVTPGAEVVVSRNARYWVVEKRGEAAERAVELDERSDAEGGPGPSRVRGPGPPRDSSR